MDSLSTTPAKEERGRMTNVVEPLPGAYPGDGDWVLVWGQIKAEPTHPDDVVVEFFSHNANWTGHVKIDRIRVSDSDLLPEFVERCTALGEVEKKSRHYLVRCAGHHDHGSDHSTRDVTWTSAETVGYFEEK